MLSAALISLAAAAANPLAGAPAWVTNPSRDLRPGGPFYQYVGVASAGGAHDRWPRPTGWAAFFNGLGETAAADLASSSFAPPAGKVALEEKTAHAFGAVEVKRLLKTFTDETASSELQVSMPGLELAASDTQSDSQVSFRLTTADTTALLQALSRAGVDVRDSWTAADGTVCVLLRLYRPKSAAAREPQKPISPELARKIAHGADAAFDQLAKEEQTAHPELRPPSLSDLQISAEGSALKVSVKIAEGDVFAPTVFVREAGAPAFEAAGLARSGGAWTATIPVEKWPAEYFVEAWNRLGSAVSRIGSLKEPRRASPAAN